MTELLISVFVLLFVVVDPIGVAPIFAALTADAEPAQRRRMAVKGVLIGGLILLGFGFLGGPLLAVLRIGMPAFRIAGGLLLLLLAIDMVMVRNSGLRATTESEHEEGEARDDISVFPLAIPLIAGPGAMTSIVLLMGNAAGKPVEQALVIGVLIGVLLLSLVCLLLTGPILKLLGVTGTNVVTRVAGVLTAALAVQFILDGILAVWPAS